MIDLPKCEQCGEGDLSVQAIEVGLCDDCAAAYVRECLRDVFGKVCGNISRRSNGYLTTCLAPYGVEHDHD
jgi:hypothetical protein